jgi:hypothetical protein
MGENDFYGDAGVAQMGENESTEIASNATCHDEEKAVSPCDEKTEVRRRKVELKKTVLEVISKAEG